LLKAFGSQFQGRSTPTPANALHRSHTAVTASHPIAPQIHHRNISRRSEEEQEEEGRSREEEMAFIEKMKEWVRAPHHPKFIYTLDEVSTIVLNCVAFGCDYA
jgi:hypothetical protein